MKDEGGRLEADDRSVVYAARHGEFCFYFILHPSSLILAFWARRT